MSRSMRSKAKPRECDKPSFVKKQGPTPQSDAALKMARIMLETRIKLLRPDPLEDIGFPRTVPTIRLKLSEGTSLGDLAAFIDGLPNFCRVIRTNDFMQSVYEAAHNAGLVNVKSARDDFHIPRHVTWGR